MPLCCARPARVADGSVDAAHNEDSLAATLAMPHYGSAVTDSTSTMVAADVTLSQARTYRRLPVFTKTIKHYNQ